MSPPATVSLESVTVTYSAGPPWARRHVRALRDITLEVAGGETLGIVGESGAGKSSLVGVCLGLVAPSAGQVLIAGHAPNSRRRQLRGQIQAVLQNPQSSLNPRLKCGTSIAEPLVVAHREPKGSRVKLVHEMLERVGLDRSTATRYPHELSGGQQQRVSIARALVTRPRLIVFDEVVSALDVSTQLQILNLISDLQQEQGFAALFVSHDLAAVRYVADRVMVLYAGETMELAPANLLYGGGAHPYTRALQASESVLGASTRYVINDVIPAENSDQQACAFELRCPLAIPRCRIEHPGLRLIQGTAVACHRAEEVIADGSPDRPMRLVPHSAES